MNSPTFVRKIIYLVLIGALLMPILLVSQPAARNKDNAVVQEGGVLSRLKNKFGLSQTRLSQIDPASETMKLASLGLRGVAVNLLWMQANDHKVKENYDQLEATLNTLIKIQPNFVKVWEFQAHNLSYNVSVEFDDYEYRYHWVKKGIRFLTEGIQYNIADHRMTDNLGAFTGMKIGNSDEKFQFRRMFRKDREYHDEMASFIEPDLYDTPEYGPDHWKMAYHWFDLSRKLVEEQRGPQLVSDLMFYMKRPAQLRNQAMGLQAEFRTDEIVREIWATSEREWKEYGDQKITNTLDQTITLNGTIETSERLDRLRQQLDEYSPNTRQDLQKDIRASLRLTDEQLAILDLPLDQRTPEQMFHVEQVLKEIERRQIAVDAELVRQLPPEKRVLALPILEEIRQANELLSTIDKNSGTVNFRYWTAHNQAELEDNAVAGHQKLYDARDNQLKSIFDDEFRLNRQTKQREPIRQGAISMFEDSYQSWSQIFEKYSVLKDGSIASDIVDSLKEYQQMLKVTGLEWPENFVLQDFIDFRAAAGDDDELPTSEQLAEIRSGKSSEEQNPAASESPAGAKPETTPGKDGSKPDPATDKSKEDAGGKENSSSSGG